MHPTPRAECRPRPGALLAALLSVVCLGPATLAHQAPDPDPVPLVAVAAVLPSERLGGDAAVGAGDGARPGSVSDATGLTDGCAVLDACRAACLALETLHYRVEYQRLDARAAEPFAPRLGRVRLQRRHQAAPRLSVIADIEPIHADALGWAYHLVADGNAAAALDTRGPLLAQAPVDQAGELFAPVDGLLPALVLSGALSGRAGEAADSENPVPAPRSVRRLGLSVIHGIRCEVVEILQADGVRVQLHVGAVDQLPRRIETHDLDGVQHVTVLWDVRPGLPLGERDFALPVPPGVEVQRSTETSSGD